MENWFYSTYKQTRESLEARIEDTNEWILNRNVPGHQRETEREGRPKENKTVHKRDQTTRALPLAAVGEQDILESSAGPRDHVI